MSWRATFQDLLALGGLPAEAYAPDARRLDGIDAVTSTFELRSHGYGGGARLRFVARAGGTLPSATPVPLTGSTWCDVVPTTDPDFFTIKIGGAPVVLADAGDGEIMALEDFGPRLDRMLLARSSWLVSWHKATRGPWDVAPDWAPMIVCQLVAADVARALRLPSARYPVEEVFKAAAAVQPFLDRIGRGEPFSDGVGPVDATPAIAEMGPAPVSLLAPGAFDLTNGAGDDIA